MCQDVRIYEESNFDLYGIVVCSDYVCGRDKRLLPTQ